MAFSNMIGTESQRHVMIACEFTIYLPTIQAAKEGGYGADSATFLEVGAGERMVSEAIASLRKLSDA